MTVACYLLEFSLLRPTDVVMDLLAHCGCIDLCSEKWHIKNGCFCLVDQTSKEKLRQGALLFRDLFPESKPGYKVLSKHISKEDILNLHAALMDAHHTCGMAWVISPTLQLDDKSGLPPFVWDLLHLDELALKEELICSEEQIKKAEENTQAQKTAHFGQK